MPVNLLQWIAGLEANGIVVSGRVPLHVGSVPANARYLETKRRRMGHLLPAAERYAAQRYRRMRDPRCRQSSAVTIVGVDD